MAAFEFWTPAKCVDFGTGTPNQAALDLQWNTNLNGFTNQGIGGNPWNQPNASGITNYFNPLLVTIPPGSTLAQIQWPAFPGRIGAYNPGLTPEQVLQLGDTGYMLVGGRQQTFPAITKNGCTGAAQNIPFGPYGPRGWQDEYLRVERGARSEQQQDSARGYRL